MMPFVTARVIVEAAFLVETLFKLLGTESSTAVLNGGRIRYPFYVTRKRV